MPKKLVFCNFKTLNKTVYYISSCKLLFISTYFPRFTYDDRCIHSLHGPLLSSFCLYFSRNCFSSRAPSGEVQWRPPHAWLHLSFLRLTFLTLSSLSKFSLMYFLLIHLMNDTAIHSVTLKKEKKRHSQVVQWLGLYILTATAEGMGSVPAWGTNILQAMQCSQRLI